MKIVLIHGDNLIEARKRFLEIITSIKKRSWEISRLDFSKNLGEQIVTDSLFAEEALFVVEDFDKLSKNDFNWLSKNSETLKSSLLIFADHELIAFNLKLFPKKTKIENFKIPKEIFKFLDSLYPGNSKTSLNFLKSLAKKEKPEFVFAMIAGHFRDLYWVSLGARGLNYPGWRMGKLKAQVARFSKQKLNSFINDLANIDLEIKRGGNPSLLLDLTIAKSLE